MTLLVNLSPFLMLGVIIWFIARAKKRFNRAVVDTAETQPAQNLIPLDLYDLDETGYWRRLPWIVSLLFGVSLGALELLLPIPGTRYSPPVCAAIALAIGGPFFGLLFPACIRARARSITAALYTGDRRFVDPPPADLFVLKQIVCSIITGPVAVGGTLYLGPGELLFVPHKRNQRPSPPLKVSPLQSVKIATVPPPPANAIQRLVAPRPRDLIELNWNGGNARFLMPTPADALVRLGRCLDALQRVPEQ